MSKKRSEAKLPSSLSDKGKKEVEQFGWPYFKAGIILVNHYGEFLLVKEAKEKQTKDGEVVWAHTDNGKWNLPCGRLRPWENFWQAAEREGTEETGYDFDTGCIRHIGFRFDINNPYLIVIYHADNPHDISITNPPDPEEISAVSWFSHDEIIKLQTSGQLRNPELVMGAIANELAGIEIPAEAITIYDSKFMWDDL